MKIQHSKYHTRQNGSVVLVVLILLFIMVAFVAANAVTLNTLRRQVKLTEQRQIHRLAQTVAVPPQSK